MYYFQGNNFDYNECSGRGMCSVTPTISSFQEVMLMLLRAMTYYVLKLEKFNIECDDLKLNIIDGVSNLISTTVYTDEQLLNLIICHYNDLVKVKRDYLTLCKREKITCKDLKIMLNLTPDMVLSDILNQGQKAIAEKNHSQSANQKFYFELMLVIIKSVSLSILKLVDYDDINKEAINKVLNAINVFNTLRVQINKMQDIIKELAELDLELWKQRKDAQFAKFGNVSKTDVSLSTKSGKAILVSGSNLMDLYNLLKNSHDENIDIYSHGDLLIAHAFEKFKSFKNFKGHFGTANDNCILDFATFPGCILLTKHATQNIEYLIRGRLFTTDDVAPKGVINVINNDFSELISTAKNAKGFSKGKKKDDIIVGFNFDELDSKFEKLKSDLESGIIKHVFIIGMANISDSQAQYFDLLMKKTKKNAYVISFSYNCDVDNFLYINIANNFPIQLAVLNMLFNKIPVTDSRYIFFLTKCDSNTLSSIISLKNMGAKNIYLSDCPPTVINPAIMNSFTQLYKINNMTNPTNDLKNILN